ncbi:receptor protein-tyrosine kinase CEPR1-like [Prosopis cineraria]|uniref:receptor protein-tyrosine kinase CEPR1-like n=1 Tax=Prosopis cineraria TaxID=364024 RepID=UPI00240EDFD4|nr:receptor protein-tyrosine kinase CEPR1-like [Prosopis cineraria]
MDRKTIFFLILVPLSCIPLVFSIDTNPSEFFALMKESFSGHYPFRWDVTGGRPVCNFTGVACNSQGDVINLDVSGWSLSGNLPENICSFLPELRVLRLSNNRLKGNFPDSIVNCSRLEELNMSYMFHAGRLPDFSPLTSLKVLDLSYNLFTGQFPMSVFNLTSLEVLTFNENEGFNLWTLPKDIYKLKNLKSMVLTTCMVQGQIPSSIGNLTSLVDLELSGNFLTGHIPPELGMLKNLQFLELYYNSLVGVIPEELGNLMELKDLDMSVNKLTGNIPESICRLPKLEVIQLYNNSLTGEIPAVIENSTSLRILSIYDNFLSGHVPRNLGQFSELVVLDLSENQLSGPLPTGVCKGGKLLYFLVLDNQFSGVLPDVYAKCFTLLRFRVSNNHLQGSIPGDLFGLPHVSIIDLGYNNFSGSISESIGNSRNLSELFTQRNQISGFIPPTVSRATNLVKIDLSYNLLSGPIPSEIGNLKRLNSLMLQGNKLNSSIPSTLSFLQSLNVLDLSNNLLSGTISESLSALLPNYINFSDNLLSGPIPSSMVKGGLLESFSGNPGVCMLPIYANSSDQNFQVCPQNSSRKRPRVVWVGAIISVALIIIGFGAVLFIRRRPAKDKASMEQDDESLSSSFFSCDLKSFHKLNYDRQEIIEAMVDKNIVGYGGSGTVYKIELKSGELIAVKKLWSRSSKDPAQEDRMVLDKELKNEVATLGSIRHKNIVKLYSYFTSFDFSLLVYEYMPNGNLWDALHKSWIHLTWPTRHQIALGIAQGLAYLHHDLLPPIIHRDIKSTNILLDAHYQPKVADFGIAKVLQARGVKDSTTTVIAGTYGYLAPEYAYSSRATTKCDVYSFGVILMELITGKKPVEVEFGENRNIVYWVSNKVDSKERISEIIDKRLSGLFSEEIIQVIRIAIKCTYKLPANRPTMKEVVQRLIDADPCKFDSGKLSDMTHPI